MRVHDILTEARNGRLYHWTVPRNFCDMARDDAMVAREFVQSGRLLRPKGISFTREPHATFMSDRSLLMVLDAAAISQNYRLTPRYGDSREAAEIAAADPEEFGTIEPRREAEEMIDRDLSPLSRYLTHLVMGNHHYQHMLEVYLKLLQGKQRGNQMLYVRDPMDAAWGVIFEYCRTKAVPVVPVPSLLSPGVSRRIDANAVDLSTWNGQRLMDEIDALRADVPASRPPKRIGR